MSSNCIATYVGAIAACGLAAAPAVAQEADPQRSAPQSTESADAEDAVTLQEIVVTATRTERPLINVPAAITVVDQDSLRVRGLTSGTDEFRGVPGIFFRRADGDSETFPDISFRGLTPNHGTDTFLALIDGIPFVGPDEEILLSQVPYGAIERIEIVRGPVSALYGRGATAGAVNYITRTPNENRTNLSAAVGSDEYYRGEATIERDLFDRGGVLLSAFYENDEGWRANSEREIVNVFGKVVAPLGERTTLSAYANYFNRDVEVPSAIPLLDNGDLAPVVGGRESYIGFPPTFSAEEGFIGAVRVEQEISDAIDLMVTGQHRRFDGSTALNFYESSAFDPSRNVYGVNGFANDSDSSIWIADAQLTAEFGRHTLVAGANYERATKDDLTSWSGQYGFTPACGFAFFLVEIDYSTGQVINRDHPCFVTDFLLTDATANNRFWGAYLQDEWRITDRVTLTLGGRYDSFRRRALFRPIAATFNPGGERSANESAFSPKASFAYRFGDDGGTRGTIYASYGRGFSSNFGPVFQFNPVLFELDLRPMTLDSYEVGFKGRDGSGVFSWEVAAFRYDQRDRLVTIENPDPTGPSSIATTGQRYRSQGIEVSGRLELRPSTTLSANYSYVDAKWREFLVPGAVGQIDLSGKRPTGVPEHILNASVEHRFADWLRARADLYVYGDYAVTGDNRVIQGGYELLNLSASIELPTRTPLTLDLALTNALDSEIYYYFGAFGSSTAPSSATPAAPRQFRATLRARF